MYKRKLIDVLVLSLVAFAVTMPVTAADDPLDYISEDVSIVVRLKKPTEVTDNLVKYISNVDEQAGAMSQSFAGLVGILISNPTQEGVDKEKDWWLGIIPESGEQPKVIFAIPASDADEMKLALPDNFTSTVADNWVIYSDNGEVISSIEEGINNSSLKSIRSKIDPEASKLLTGSSLSAFINVKSLTETYKNEIEMGIQQAEEGLDQFQNMSPPVQGMDVGAIFGLYKDLFKGAVRAVKDARGITIGVNITESDLILERLTQFEKGSETAKFIEAHQPSKMETLSKLPANQLGYFGFYCDTKTLVDFSIKFMSQMMNSENYDPALAEDLKKKIDSLKVGANVGSFDLGDLQEGALRMVSIYDVTPAEKARGLAEEYIKFADMFKTPLVEQEMTYKKDAETVDGQKIDLMTVTQHFSEEADPLGIQNQIMAALYGPEGMQTRIAYMDNNVIQAVGGGTAAMEKAIASVKQPATNSVTAPVREKLSENANLLGLVDLPTLAVKAITIASDSGQIPLPIDPEALQDLGIRPSYLGVSVAVEPQSIRGRMVLPSQQVQGIVKLVKFFRTMNQQPQF